MRCQLDGIVHAFDGVVVRTVRGQEVRLEQVALLPRGSVNRCVNEIRRQPPW